MPTTACEAPPPSESDSFPSCQSVVSTAKQINGHFPVIINHSSPKSIRKVLAANTVPKSTLEHGLNPQIKCLCCVIEVIESHRLRNCLYATAFVPASMLFLLFVLVWLSELGLI